MIDLLTELNLDLDEDRFDPLCDARPLLAHSAAKLLRTVLQHCDGGVLAFDLDSTLLDNRPRNAQILREYGESVNNEILANAQPQHWHSWSRSDAMLEAGLANEDLPQHRTTFENFWNQRFFTSEYCTADVAVKGAAQFTTRVASAGASTAYITGRPERMRAGTMASLQRYGFPVPHDSAKHSNKSDQSNEKNDESRPEVRLIMRPVTEDSDDDFKRLIAFPLLHKLAQNMAQKMAQKMAHKTGNLIAAFDNEPSHINAYRAEFPQAIAVHLFTDHSMREVKLDNGIVSIRYFAAH